MAPQGLGWLYQIAAATSAVRHAKGLSRFARAPTFLSLPNSATLAIAKGGPSLASLRPACEQAVS
jgi:hypothetical protein